MPAAESDAVLETGSFFDLSDEEISAMVGEATTAAVANLHRQGISTYGQRDGILYETKPSGKTVIVKVSEDYPGSLC